MADRRLDLHRILCGFVPKRRDEHRNTYVCDVYFQPPANIQMHYPCIRYERTRILPFHADNAPYHLRDCYTVTVIDPDPDSDIPRRIAGLSLCTFNRHYIADNLNHDVFTLYF